MKIYAILIKYGNKLRELIFETPYLISQHRGFLTTPHSYAMLKASLLTPEWVPFKSSGKVVLSLIELPYSIMFETTHNPLSHQLRGLPSIVFQPTKLLLPPKHLIEVSGFSNNYFSPKDLKLHFN